MRVDGRVGRFELAGMRLAGRIAADEVVRRELGGRWRRAEAVRGADGRRVNARTAPRYEVGEDKRDPASTERQNPWAIIEPLLPPVKTETARRRGRRPNRRYGGSVGSAMRTTACVERIFCVGGLGVVDPGALVEPLTLHPGSVDRRSVIDHYAATRRSSTRTSRSSRARKSRCQNHQALSPLQLIWVAAAASCLRIECLADRSNRRSRRCPASLARSRHPAQKVVQRIQFHWPPRVQAVTVVGRIVCL
jgi:hypothetical protein